MESRLVARYDLVLRRCSFDAYCVVRNRAGTKNLVDSAQRLLGTSVLGNVVRNTYSKIDPSTKVHLGHNTAGHRNNNSPILIAVLAV